jgi:hypothetical protein
MWTTNFALGSVVQRSNRYYSKLGAIGRQMLSAQATLISNPLYGNTCPAMPTMPLTDLWGPIFRNCLDKIRFCSRGIGQFTIPCSPNCLCHELGTEYKTEISIGSLLRAVSCSHCAVHSMLQMD